MCETSPAGELVGVCSSPAVFHVWDATWLHDSCVTPIASKHSHKILSTKHYTFTLQKSYCLNPTPCTLTLHPKARTRSSQPKPPIPNPARYMPQARGRLEIQNRQNSVTRALSHLMLDQTNPSFRLIVLLLFWGCGGQPRCQRLREADQGLQDSWRSCDPGVGFS